MSAEISEETKKQILDMIKIPGMEICEIAKKLGLDDTTIMDILGEEYFKYDLDRGRRMCCR